MKFGKKIIEPYPTNPHGVSEVVVVDEWNAVVAYRDTGSDVKVEVWGNEVDPLRFADVLEEVVRDMRAMARDGTL